MIGLKPGYHLNVSYQTDKEELRKWAQWSSFHTRYLRTERSKLLFTVTVVVQGTFWV